MFQLPARYEHHAFCPDLWLLLRRKTTRSSLARRQEGEEKDTFSPFFRESFVTATWYHSLPWFDRERVIRRKQPIWGMSFLTPGKIRASLSNQSPRKAYWL